MSDKRGRQDHYEVLGVSSSAPDEVIRAAYRALAAKNHPDRNPNDRDAELKLKKLNAAFQVLGDPAKRRHYDELTRSPEANDEPRGEPPRPQVPKRAVREEPPRWKVPGEDRAPSNTVERTVTRTAGGFGRVIGWILGFAIVSAAFAGFHNSCSEKPRYSDSTATPTTTVPAQRVWVTQPDYAIAFPAPPAPAEQNSVSTNC